MKRFLHITLVLLITIVFASSNSFGVSADGEEGEHALEVEVNGIHVLLASKDEWKRGENTIVVTLKDEAGLPVSDAHVEVFIRPKSAEHAEAEETHGVSEPLSGHEAVQGHSSMSGADAHEAETLEQPAPDGVPMPLLLSEQEDHGIYVTETHFESSGAHELHVMFSVNGEKVQANFEVEIPNGSSRTIVLWSFAVINIVLITSAGILKKQTLPVKGV